MKGKWTVEEGKAYLSSLEQGCEEYGGACAYTPEELVRAVHHRQIVSKGDEAEARSLLSSRPGWKLWKDATWIYRAKDGRPDGSYRRHFQERFKYHAVPTELGSGGLKARGPITIRDIGTGLGLTGVGVKRYVAEWGRMLFEEEGWIPAVCPPHVHPLDVAWYPPPKAKEASPE